ncbi:MAG: DUF4275 family protein [Neobacillus sp.]
MGACHKFIRLKDGENAFQAPEGTPGTYSPAPSTDIYIMDWNIKWTFIMTHEPDFGPYFIQKT